MPTKRLLNPTVPPTLAPAPEGHAQVEQTKEVGVVEVAMTWPVTIAQAHDSVFGLSLEEGTAAALGFPASSVKVTHVDGQAMNVGAEGRRLLSSADITLAVTSNTPEPADLATLRSDVLDAAAEGSLVLNVQLAAMNNGVLTEEVLSMNQHIAVQTTVKTEVVREYVLMIPTDAPTPIPTTSPTYNGPMDACLKNSDHNDIKFARTHCGDNNGQARRWCRRFCGV